MADDKKLLKPASRRMAGLGPTNTKVAATVTAIAVCLGVLAVTPTSAQTSTAPTSQDATSQHHQWIYRMMKDMTQEMTRMTEQMSGTELTPDQRSGMAQRMQRMSTMMRRLSGLAARPVMRDRDWRRQADQMRKQMDEMMGERRMKPDG